MWFLFGVVRTEVVNRTRGKISGLMKQVLYMMFPQTGTSFSTGLLLSHGAESKIVQATFSGFIADEKALKEVFGTKGASGKKTVPNLHECGAIR